MEPYSMILPSFRRLAWSSVKAKEVWEPRITRVVTAWYDIEWLSIVSGIRECTILSPPFWEATSRLEGWRNTN